jgi:aryl-alcohol dehydrogenase-like predicted oxidoreductase
VITQLGRTGLRVTRIGLGLAALGRPGYINLGHASDLDGRTDVASMERGAHAVLDAAYAGGVRYFDAARSYGKAEAFLGSWLSSRGFGRDDVTVGSKWGYTYTADWRVDAEVNEVKDLTASTFRRQLAETRELLGDHLRLYQIHSATLESGVLEDRDVLDELAGLRSSGVFIGLSTSGPEQGATIERAISVGGFDSVQSTWNVLERSAGPALATAHAAGMGVIIKEALANGRLTDRGDVPALIAAAREAGVTPDALALGFVLAQPWVDVVLSGATTVPELESNLGALAVDVDSAAFDGLVEDPDAYWKHRAELPWN